MSAPPPSNSTSTSNILSTHRALVDTLISFLTVSSHHILYLRRLYPPLSFLSTRAYNFPVRQNRHPAVCTWVNDAMAAVRDQLEKNTVETVSLCIYECQKNRVLERWTFDLRSLPVVARADRDVPFDTSADASLSRNLNVTDLQANFRGTLSRISNAASRLTPLPEGPDAPECSFTITIEVKDNADRPVGRLENEERKWIAAEPESFGEGEDDRLGPDSHSKTHAVRRLEAGELRMEVWVEEAAAKFEYPTTQRTAAERNASMSFGAGSEKFDPEHGYELEAPDINRKPQGGRGEY